MSCKFKHLIERRSVDMQDRIGAQCDLVAEFQHATVVGATHLVPIVRVVVKHFSVTRIQIKSNFKSLSNGANLTDVNALVFLGAECLRVLNLIYT